MNRGIRQKMHESGVYQWQVAKAIGISEYTLCKWLREELQGERLKQVSEAIERVRRDKDE